MLCLSFGVTYTVIWYGHPNFESSHRRVIVESKKRMKECEGGPVVED